MEYLAEINATTIDAVIAAHAGTEWWVTSVGFQPGCYQALPLDPAFSISAPKTHVPDSGHPERILCLAGKITSFYPVRSPGGYQLLGRTPLDLYDPLQRNEVFRDSPVLPIAGERHRYVPIDDGEYHDVRQHVERGAYRYDIQDGKYVLAITWRGWKPSPRRSPDARGDRRWAADYGAGSRPPGYLHTGMPPSGAFDSFALRVANVLVGNNPGGRYLVGRDPGDAGLEVLLFGCRLRATEDHIIAVTGGDLSPTLNDKPLPMWQAVRIRAGDVIVFRSPRAGVRAYLAIAGGSTFLPSSVAGRRMCGQPWAGSKDAA